jgi:hypothetical protein
MGLRAGLKLIRGMRRSLSEEQQHIVAREIVDHLESTNWKIEKGPLREGHGPHLMSKLVPRGGVANRFDGDEPHLATCGLVARQPTSWPT